MGSTALCTVVLAGVLLWISTIHAGEFMVTNNNVYFSKEHSIFLLFSHSPHVEVVFILNALMEIVYWCC